MNLSIHVRSGCEVCERILKIIKHKKLNIKIKHSESIVNEQICFITPALFDGEKLLAYGADILPYLKQNKTIL